MPCTSDHEKAENRKGGEKKCALLMGLCSCSSVKPSKVLCVLGCRWRRACCMCGVGGCICSYKLSGCLFLQRESEWKERHKRGEYWKEKEKNNIFMLSCKSLYIYLWNDAYIYIHKPKSNTHIEYINPCKIYIQCIQNVQLVRFTFKYVRIFKRDKK